MSLIIRDALPGDAPALTRLNSIAMGYGYPQEKTAQKLDMLIADCRNKLLVAETDGAVIGYVHLVDYDLLYNDSLKNIMGIAVDPAHQRKGVGKALLCAGEAAGVRLVSGESRTGAHAFYRSLGYQGNKFQLNLKKIF